MHRVKSSPQPAEKIIPRHVQIRRQKEHIAALRRAGKPTAFAEAFLAILEEPSSVPGRGLRRSPPLGS